MKTVIRIKGTHCNACKLLIEDVCKDNKDISSCNVDFKTGGTEIEHNNRFKFDELKKEIEALGGYKVITV